MNLVVLGAPGAGKGAQGKKLSSYFNIAHISTGDLLRKEMRDKTPLGISIEETMNRGEFVGDEVVTTLLKNRLSNDDCKKGFILDGYPRNLVQAQLLIDIVKIDCVIYFFVPDSVIMDRMAGRYVCPDCGSTYNVRYLPPKVAFKCDACGGNLFQREDDKEKTVLKRLETYHKFTAPIIDFYREKNILIEVDGTMEMDKVTEEVVKKIGDRL